MFLWVFPSVFKRFASGGQRPLAVWHRPSAPRPVVQLLLPLPMLCSIKWPWRSPLVKLAMLTTWRRSIPIIMVMVLLLLSGTVADNTRQTAPIEPLLDASSNQNSPLADKPLVKQPLLRLIAADLPPYIDTFAEGLGVVPPLVQMALAPHFQVEVSLTSWSSLLQQAKAPRHLLLYWQRSVELEKEWYFSEPLLAQQYGFFYQAQSRVAASAAGIQTLNHLQGFRIGVLAGMQYGREFSRVQHVLQRVEFSSEFAIFQALQQGRVDVALVDVVQATQILHAQPQQKILRLAQPILTVDQLYLLCSRNYLPCHEILLQFKQRWQQLTTDGTLHRVLGIDAIGTQ